MDDIIRRFKRLDVEDEIEVVPKPKLPKGKRTAYIMFSLHQSSLLKAKGQKLTVGQLSKHCSQRWKEVSAKDKEKFTKMSNEDMTRYNKEMADYEKLKLEYNKYIDILHDKGLLKTLDDQKKVEKFLAMDTKEQQILMSKVPNIGITKKKPPMKATQQKDKEEEEEEESEDEEGSEEESEESGEESGEESESEDEKEDNDKAKGNGNGGRLLAAKNRLDFDELLEEEEEEDGEKSESNGSESESEEGDKQVNQVNDNILTEESDSEDNKKTSKIPIKRKVLTKKKESVPKTTGGQKGGKKVAKK